MALPPAVKKKMIGITGGIGSGKSRVAQFLQEITGAACIDVDTVCRSLLAKGEPGWLAVKKKWGNIFFSREDEIDRPFLRRKIFSDEKVRAELDGIIHPLAREIVWQKAQEYARDKTIPGILVEVPLLFEAHWEEDFFKIVVVVAGDKQCMERLIKRDSVSPAAAVRALSAQWPLAEKMKWADYVVDNNDGWTETSEQLIKLAPDLWGG